MQAIPRCSIEDCEKYVVWNCGENGKYCTEHYNEQSREIRESRRVMNIQQFKHKKSLVKLYRKKPSKKPSKKSSRKPSKKSSRKPSKKS